jgi:hypothetical protein
MAALAARNVRFLGHRSMYAGRLAEQNVCMQPRSMPSRSFSMSRSRLRLLAAAAGLLVASVLPAGGAFAQGAWPT